MEENLFIYTHMIDLFLLIGATPYFLPFLRPPLSLYAFCVLS